ncbi:MAG: sulfatase-like hydrolase/transferase [Bryobacteraceae bacterium]|nr:sulfatase-like hydrolase/transferase [Bryobacteraceae bacterium]
MTSRRHALAAFAGTAYQAPKRPNLLYIIADDHAGYVLGAQGNALAETPNLDRLASQGTRFARHFCNSPVCTPSRQSLLTGQLPHAAGVTVLKTPLSTEKPTLAKQLKQAGYRTGVIGKMHFNQPGRAGLHGFDYCQTEGEVQRAWMATVKPSALPEGVRVKPPWKPFQDPARIWLNAEKLPFGRVEAEMKSLYQLRLADEFLGAASQQPFALWLSFQEPHSPYDFPLEDRNAFDPRRFPVPRVGPEDAGQIPLIFRDLSPAEKQGIIAAYYTSVRFLDRNVGRALDLLKKHGLEQNTLVVYLADHGYSLGQHGRFEKHCGYMPALHVPLMMRWPGKIRQGTVRDFTEHIDLPHTLTDLLGLEALPVRHGQSLRPYLEGKSTKPRDHVFSTYLENEECYAMDRRWKCIFGSGRRARTDGYVTENPKPGRYVKLFDLQNDEGEFTNVAAKHPREVERLQGLMLARFRATHPEASQEPARLSREESLEWYVRPRDA